MSFKHNALRTKQTAARPPASFFLYEISVQLRKSFLNLIFHLLRWCIKKKNLVYCSPDEEIWYGSEDCISIQLVICLGIMGKSEVYWCMDLLSKIFPQPPVWSGIDLGIEIYPCQWQKHDRLPLVFLNTLCRLDWCWDTVHMHSQDLLWTNHGGYESPYAGLICFLRSSQCSSFRSKNTAANFSHSKFCPRCSKQNTMHLAE